MNVYKLLLEDIENIHIKECIGTYTHIDIHILAYIQYLTNNRRREDFIK